MFTYTLALPSWVGERNREAGWCTRPPKRGRALATPPQQSYFQIEGMNSWDDRGASPRSGSFAILETRVPAPGVDYPETSEELALLFGTARSCWQYLEQMRFPRGFVCPRCEARERPWRSGTGLLACERCKTPVVLTQGTLFHGSAVPLSRWMHALWEVTDRESGLAAGELQQVLGLRDVQQAGEVLARIRRLMTLPAQRPLSGEVGLAIARVGLDGDALHGAERPAVMLAFDLRRGEPRIRLRHLPRVTASAVSHFAAAHVEPRSRVVTAPWRGFNVLSRSGYDHRPQAASGGEGLPGAQQIWSLLELWLWSTPGVEPHALQAHLDEFTFRFNRRGYPRGLLFYRLVILAVLYEHAREGALLESA